MAKQKRSIQGEQLLWVVDNAVAYVDNGRVTLQVDKPTRFLPRPQVFEVADKIWFANQMKELEIARQQGETKVIPLTDRRRRSSLRLGGGFMITQGTNLVVVQRQLDAPRPGQFSECGGVFEVLEPGNDLEMEDVVNDFVASLLKESQEIAIIRKEYIYIPQLAPYPPVRIGFQPPGTLVGYNKINEDEVIHESLKAQIPFNRKKVRKFWMKMLDYENAVRLEFAYSPPLSVEVTAEIDTSSLEFVGVISLPENIDLAVESYYMEEISRLEKELEKSTGKLEIQKELDENKKELRKFQKEVKSLKGKPKDDGFDYWDTELSWDRKKKEEGPPVHRDVHLINFITGDDMVSCKQEDELRREWRKSTLWRELSKIRLGPSGTRGRVATEKLERAIKMHCPVPRLQPLITL